MSDEVLAATIQAVGSLCAACCTGVMGFLGVMFGAIAVTKREKAVARSATKAVENFEVASLKAEMRHLESQLHDVESEIQYLHKRSQPLFGVVERLHSRREELVRRIGKIQDKLEVEYFVPPSNSRLKRRISAVPSVPVLAVTMSIVLAFVTLLLQPAIIAKALQIAISSPLWLLAVSAIAGGGAAIYWRETGNKD